MARRRRSKSTGGLVVLAALFAIGFIVVFGKAVVDYVSWQDKSVERVAGRNT